MLLLVALVLVVRARRRLPFNGRLADWLALAFGALVVLYGVLPQSWLGGGATHKGVLYAARHDLLPVGAYFLGRGLDLTERERARLCHTVLAAAAFVAAFGLVDVYAVPLSWWRPVAGWFHDQLGLRYFGLSGLPENFVYNAGNGVVFRRLTSTFLSPLATSYLLVVALFFMPMRRRWGPPLASAALRRAAVDAHALRVARARRRACAARDRRAGACGRSVCGGGRGGDRGRVREGLRPLRPAHALHRERAAGSRSGTRSEHPQAFERRDERRTSRRPASILRRCATECARCSIIRGASGSATRA